MSIKKIKCKYWIIKNLADEIILKHRIGLWLDLGYKYPYVVGKEKAFTFQQQDIAPIKDFYSEKENLIYTYQLQEL